MTKKGFMPGEHKNDIQEDNTKHHLLFSLAFQRLHQSIILKRKIYYLENDYKPSVAGIMKLLDKYIQKMDSVEKFLEIYCSEYNLENHYEERDFRKLERSLSLNSKKGIFYTINFLEENEENLKGLDLRLKSIKDKFENLYTTITRMYYNTNVENNDLKKLQKFSVLAEKEYEIPYIIECTKNLPNIENE